MTLKESGHDHALEFLRELVQAQSAGEETVQKRISERLQLIGCVIEQYEYDPAKVPVVGEFAADESRASERRTAVVGTLSGDDDKRSLLMFAHPDGEPVVDAKDWKHDPFYRGNRQRSDVRMGYCR